jgi:hypothetical protein
MGLTQPSWSQADLLDQALERASAHAEAGADGVYPFTNKLASLAQEAAEAGLPLQPSGVDLTCTDNIRNARLAGCRLYVGGLTRARMFPTICIAAEGAEPTQNTADSVARWCAPFSLVNIDLHMLGDVSLRSSRLSIIG